jgi:hypothetical protein
MANLLRALAVPTIVFALALTQSFMVTRGLAQSQVSGPFTGYAFGNATGASGNAVENGDFANHYNCPNDPANSWTYGSIITFITPSTIEQHNEWGSTTWYTGATLDDAGDPFCLEANYWADIYFGRHKNASEACDCSGSPSPGFCRDNQAGYTGNACVDATNFGRVNATYWSP